ncbi:hypothetical protein TWF730_011194 [Orbilia blumenaviensis]|uniref:Uncharacterized protein n=1 Tax=Orbilia blumenaviensis TaxID=1796055 RepID=A0AAV9UL52_9PEZI
MKVSTSVILGLVALLSPASGAPAATDPSSVTNVLTITGSIVPGGPELNLTGTLEELIPKIKEVYPNWDPLANPDTEKRSIEARYFQGSPTCWQAGDWDAAWKQLLAYNVPYLQNLGNAACGHSAVQECTRVSCSWGNAIYLCGKKSVGVPCKRIGDAAKTIAEKCYWSEPLDINRWTRGYWADTTGYYVKVAGDRC